MGGVSVFLGREVHIAMNCMRCACSTFTTAKITVLHQQIKPKKDAVKQGRSSSIPTRVYFHRTFLQHGLRDRDPLCKRTFLTHTVILQSLTADISKMRGLRIQRAGYCTPCNINVPTSCWFMKPCCGWLTYVISSSFQAIQSQDSSFCVDGELDIY